MQKVLDEQLWIMSEFACQWCPHLGCVVSFLHLSIALSLNYYRLAPSSTALSWFKFPSHWQKNQESQEKKSHLQAEPQPCRHRKVNPALAFIGHLPPMEGLSEGKVPFTVSNHARLIPRKPTKQNAQLPSRGLNLSVPLETDLSWLVKGRHIVCNWIWKGKRIEVVDYFHHVCWVLKVFSVWF